MTNDFCSCSLTKQSVPQTCFGSYFQKEIFPFLGLSKIEDLPDEQEDKRSIISKINKKAKQLVYEEINCE